MTPAKPCPYSLGRFIFGVKELSGFVVILYVVMALAGPFIPEPWSFPPMLLCSYISIRLAGYFWDWRTYMRHHRFMYTVGTLELCLAYGWAASLHLYPVVAIIDALRFGAYI